MTASLTVPESDVHWVRIIKEHPRLGITCNTHHHDWVLATKHATSMTLSDLDWSQLSDFFNIPALKPVHVHFPRSSEPKYILYVHHTSYIPAFVKPIDVPMLDIYEGSSQLVFFCNSNFQMIPSLELNIEIPPTYRHVKTPMLFNTLDNTVHGYRSAQQALQSLFSTYTPQTGASQ